MKLCEIQNLLAFHRRATIAAKCYYQWAFTDVLVKSDINLIQYCNALIVLRARHEFVLNETLRDQSLFIRRRGRGDF